MAEDDGLLVNWSVSSEPSAPAKTMPQVKGGWKTKRQAVKTFRRSERIKQRQALPTPPNSQTTAEPSLKPKPERVGKKTPSEHVKPQVAHKPEGQTSKPQGEKVVSSLFDRNTDVLPTKLLESSESAEPTNAPTGEGTFPALKVPPVLHAALEAQKIETPSIIQRKAIPQIYEGRRDVMMIAQTGSGKTLAFCLPIMAHLANNREINRKSGVFAVILAPTRELASQTFEVLSHLARGCQRIVPVLLIGGEKRKSEKERLRRGANIIVGTPGRVGDHLRNTQSVSLIDVRWVVLDEGDRLVELGFEETLSEILETIEKAANPSRSRFAKTLPSTVTKVVVSATMSGSITRLGTLALTDPVWVSADSTDSAEALEGEYPDWVEPTYETNTGDADEQPAEPPVITERAPGQLIQQVIICPMKLRLVTLAARLEMFSRKSGNERALVFFSSADSINFHFAAFTSEDSAGAELNEDDELEEEDEEEDSGTETEDHVSLPGNRLAGCPMVFKLHGGLTQAQRTKSLRGFAKAEGKAILLCTDVASRGLDVPIGCVIEYDPPPSVADHLHRVGRTARAGAAGLALLFLLPSEKEYAPNCIAPVHESKLVEHSAEQLLSAAHGRDWQNAATRWQLLIERWVLASSKAKATARAGFVAHMRAYATHAHAERKYFVFGAVHTGHLAKCFGLRETPRLLGSQDSKAHPKKKKSGMRLLMVAARRHANIGDFNVA